MSKETTAGFVFVVQFTGLEGTNKNKKYCSTYYIGV